MTAPRSWNRRESNVSIAGYFTVLRSTGWFSALRLPGGFRYRIKGAGPDNPALTSTLPAAPGSLSSPKLRSADLAASQETETSYHLTMLRTQDRHLVRLALVVPAALAVTALVLWWAIWCVVSPN